MLTIQVNVTDAPQLRTHLDRIKDAAGIRSEIEIAISVNVPAGGCILESELGIIDARLETQLQCLEEALMRGVTGAS
jgi:type III secretion protein L